MFRLFSEGPAVEKARKRTPIRLGMALIAVVGMLLAPLALAASAASASARPHATVQGSYVSVTPFRIVDTRTGATDPATYAGQTLAGGGTLNVQVTGVGTTPVPAGASAVVLNVTAVDPSTNGFLSVFPEGTTLPLVSDLNFAPGVIVANLVTAPLSASGGISIFNHAGNTDVVVDVEGYYTSSPAANGSGLYNPLSPVRALGTLAVGATIAANTSTAVTVTGSTTGVPASASAVVVNLTAANATGPSFLTVYPAGATMPTASNLNFIAQATNVAIANRVTVGVGTNGQIEVYNHTNTVDVDVDVSGYYSGSGGTGSAFVPITPVRVADTRTISPVGTETTISAESSELFTLDTAGSGIPAAATAVAANFTVIPGDANGYLTVYPKSDATVPVASDLNWTESQYPAVPNYTIADTAGTGTVEVYDGPATGGANVDVVVDAFGYFVPPITPSTTLAIAVPTAALGTVNNVLLASNGTSTVAINATVKDGLGGPLVSGDTVLFTVSPSVSGDTCGTLSSATAVTNSSGVASVTYTAPAYSTSDAPVCTITATDSLYGQSWTGTIQSTTSNTLTGSLATSSILSSWKGTAATGAAVTPATDVVTAVATPVPGYSAANDTVTFTENAAEVTAGICGTFTGSVTTITGSTGPTNTAVSVTYTEPVGGAFPGPVGFCTITVTDASGGKGTVTIDQTTNPETFPPSVTFSPTSASVNVSSGATAGLFGVTVANSSGAVVGDPLEVAITGTGCSDASATVTTSTTLTTTVTSATGTAVVNYTAGATATTCVVTVTEADGAQSGSAVVTQTTVANKVTVTAVPSAVAPGVTSDITVYASAPSSTDIGGAVTFTVTPVVSGFTGCGAAPASTTLASSDYAYSTYVAGTAVGFCTITATLVDGTNGSVTVTQT
jgi:hypothetical protein